MEATEQQVIIYGFSMLSCNRDMRAQKVYNWADMDVDLGLDEDPNTLDHEI